MSLTRDKFTKLIMQPHDIYYRRNKKKKKNAYTFVKEKLTREGSVTKFDKLVKSIR